MSTSGNRNHDDAFRRGMTKHRVIAETALHFAVINVAAAAVIAAVALAFPGWWMVVIAIVLVATPMIVATVIGFTAPASLMRDVAIIIWLLSATLTGAILYIPAQNFLTTTL